MSWLIPMVRNYGKWSAFSMQVQSAYFDLRGDPCRFSIRFWGGAPVTYPPDPTLARKLHNFGRNRGVKEKLTESLVVWGRLVV